MAAQQQHQSLSAAAAEQQLPRFFCPLDARRAGAGVTTEAEAVSLPLLLYLPGLDGTGYAAVSQFASLGVLFEVNCLSLPKEEIAAGAPSGYTFQDLVACVCAHVAAAQEAHPGRPVVLLGESMGGVVALATVAQCQPGSLAAVVLVNPATSFATSAWPVLGPLLPSLPMEVYNLVPFALAPILGDPIRLAFSALAGAAEVSAQRGSEQGQPGGAADVMAQATSALVGSLMRLGGLAEILPPATLARRLQLLTEGCRLVDAALKDGAVLARMPPVQIFVGDADRLIPSAEEGPRLARLLPKATVQVVAGSHMLLQEGSLNLASALRDCGMYHPLAVSAARVAAAARAEGQEPQADARPARRMRPPTSKTIALGAAAMPSQEAVAKARQSVTPLRRIVSPVFLSTSPAGEVEQGLRHMPVASGAGAAPVLFVGNHTLLAIELGLLIDEVLTHKGMLLRGLAHPVVFQQAQAQAGGFLGGGNGGEAMSNTFQAFGAVPVSGRNLYTLLAAGEAVLLFPGGVREAYKRKGEQNTLQWPRKAEFVRHAIRTGATIVPFAAIGADDSVQIVADAGDVLATPFLGDLMRERARQMPAARAVDTRATEEGAPEELFLPPVVAPNGLPRRFYWKFGKPIECAHMDPAAADDPQLVDAMYESVKADVQGGIQYLLAKRENDPFGDTGARLLWEAAAGRQAPSFKP
jgi:pimeloyl-ACP methyl ester carboxylesterase